MDVFNNNAFSNTSLSAAIQTAPYKPRLIGQMGLFEPQPIRTTVAWIERKKGKLSIISSAARGTMKDVRSTQPRTAVPFKVPHYPYFQNILADDIQNIRAFGSEELEEMMDHVNEQLEGMKDDHEVTQEYGRVSALKGIVYDGDGTTVIYNYFTEFSLTQTTVAWLSTDAEFSTTTNAITRAIAAKLGNETFSGILALCGDNYFDAIIKHASVKTAYDRWQFGEFFRTQKIGQYYTAAENSFSFQNITFINYRGAIGNLTFIPTAEAYYIPLGVPGLFKEVIAPADMMPFVNTKGKRWYASKEYLPHNKGVQLHTQSNILPVPTRPDLIIKSTWAAA